MKVLLGFTIAGMVAAMSSSSASAAQAAPQVKSDSSRTFARDVAPLIYQHCASCHRPGGSAPFSLLTYADTRARARQIVSAVSDRVMPPWKPEPGFGEFAGVRRLTDAQVHVFEGWLRDGSQQGDMADAPEPPHWSDEWQLGQPDLVLRLPVPYTMPAGGSDRMRNFVIPVPLSTERFVKAWEFRTDNPQVVHHATMVLDHTRASRILDEADTEPGYEGLIPLSAQNPEGYFLGWTPGQAPYIAPDRLAWRLAPATDLVLMLHLRPTQKIETVTASVALYFSEQAPSEHPAMVRLNRQDIDIPAGNPHYTISDSYTLPVAVSVYGVQPHAHNLAREIKGSAILPDGTVRPLIYIRSWDVHWQDAYRFKDPIPLPAGTQLRMEYAYDNSANNPANPNYPPARITYGQRTSDEMGDLWIQVVPRNPLDLPVLTSTLERKLLPENIVGYRMMIASDPSNVGLHDDLALLYVEGGDLQSASAQFAESLRLQPRSPSANYNAGNAELMLGQYTDAGGHFQAAVALNPDYGLAYQGLGLTLKAQGRFDEAERNLDEAVRLLGSAESHYNRGVLRQAQGRDSAAAADYREAARLAPGDRQVQMALGTIEAAAGHCVEAANAFRSATTDLRNVSVPQLELAWVLATCRDHQVRNPPEAIAMAQHVVALQVPPSAHALDVLAAAFAAAGQFDDAVVACRRAIGRLTAEDENNRRVLEDRLRLYVAHIGYEGPAPAPQ